MSRAVLSDQFDLAFPRPGTIPIPEGHVRLFHYTDDKGLAGIRKEGLKVSSSRGETYGEPNLIWAAAGMPKEDSFGYKNFIEFHLDPKDLDIGRGRDPSELEKYQSHVTSYKDIPRENIVATHEPWQQTARYVLDDDRTFDEWANNDDSTFDPDTDRALSVVRGLHRGFQ